MPSRAAATSSWSSGSSAVTMPSACTWCSSGVTFSAPSRHGSRVAGPSVPMVRARSAGVGVGGRGSNGVTSSPLRVT
jgi:hypothetical protein